MRIPTAPIVIGFIAAFISLAPLTIESRQESTSSWIEGEWILDTSLSDKLPTPSADQQKTSRADRDDARRGARGGFGGIGVGDGFLGRGPVGNRDRKPDPNASKALQSAIEDLTTAPRRMTIVITDRSEVLITYGDGRVVRLIPDERKHSGLAGTSMRVSRNTRWQDTQLITDIELESRTKIELHQTYHVEQNGSMLHVTSTFDGDRFKDYKDQAFTLIYERESPI